MKGTLRALALASAFASLTGTLEFGQGVNTKATITSNVQDESYSVEGVP
jgi:hypothetical protein